MSSIKTFNISFPAGLADQVDQKAKEQFGSRSDFLRYAALKYLREEQELEELLVYGKQIGKTAKHRTEEELADYFTEKRRDQEPWRTTANKGSNR
jgi:metal-responsive CopG/Arc/MetJ family transcriptional regulator